MDLVQEASIEQEFAAEMSSIDLTKMLFGPSWQCLEALADHRCRTWLQKILLLWQRRLRVVEDFFPSVGQVSVSVPMQSSVDSSHPATSSGHSDFAVELIQCLLQWMGLAPGRT